MDPIQVQVQEGEVASLRQRVSELEAALAEARSVIAECKCKCALGLDTPQSSSSSNTVTEHTNWLALVRRKYPHFKTSGPNYPPIKAALRAFQSKHNLLPPQGSKQGSSKVHSIPPHLHSEFLSVVERVANAHLSRPQSPMKPNITQQPEDQQEEQEVDEIPPSKKLKSEIFMCPEKNCHRTEPFETYNRLVSHQSMYHGAHTTVTLRDGTDIVVKRNADHKLLCPACQVGIRASNQFAKHARECQGDLIPLIPLSPNSTSRTSTTPAPIPSAPTTSNSTTTPRPTPQTDTLPWLTLLRTLDPSIRATTASSTYRAAQRYAFQFRRLHSLDISNRVAVSIPKHLHAEFCTGVTRVLLEKGIHLNKNAASSISTNNPGNTASSSSSSSSTSSPTPAPTQEIDMTDRVHYETLLKDVLSTYPDLSPDYKLAIKRGVVAFLEEQLDEAQVQACVFGGGGNDVEEVGDVFVPCYYMEEFIEWVRDQFVALGLLDAE
ncbi:hypothetical protein HDU79_002325 [Rhizoclosmatium sp. JEL0117]|nr:hypothetical protein HDU79_002325 [Rhizoclosmatium sp. JEL0117]